MSKKTETNPLLLNFKEAASLAGVDYRTIKAGVERGTIPSLDMGARIYIPREAFLRLLREGEGK